MIRAAAALLVLLLSGHGGGAGRTLKTTGTVVAIAADGDAAAIHVHETAKGKRCERVLIWSTATGSAVKLKPFESCVSTSYNDVRVVELGFAGGRAVWLDLDYGNHSYCTLVSATATGKPNEVSACDPEDSDREFHGFVGDGSLLVLNSWYSCNAPGATCPSGDVSDVVLLRLARNGGSLVTIRKGPLWRTAVSVDAGRIVLRRPDGAVVLVRSDGTAYRGFPSPAKDQVDAKLEGSDLVILKRGSISIFDADTGLPRATWPVPATAKLLDVQTGVALLRDGRRLLLVRLADGKEAAISPPGKGAVSGQLEAPGLVYGYSVSTGAQRGRVVFEPFGALATRFGT